MKRTEKEIIERLFALQDLKFRDFQCKLIPNIPTERIVGVRTPALRALARELRRREDIEDFLSALPHRYFEENQLHAFLISLESDYDKTVEWLDVFLPHVDNWATCDQMSPKVFRRHRAELLAEIDRWLVSEHPYTVRFGIGMLMQHYLDEDFRSEYLSRVADLRSGEYYVNMMIAWYFATALAKRYEETLPYIEQRRLDLWTHNKTIQKAIESDRIPDAAKESLRRLKIKK